MEILALSVDATIPLPLDALNSTPWKANRPSFCDVAIVPRSITRLNEPGMNFFPELKQPVAKKKIIVEELPVDDLYEINLNSKLDEQRAIKYSTSNNTNTTNKQSLQKNNKPEFAFF